ncbi:MAG: UDP-N-acetylmuramoyl-tripeptide--D-alanyl-D-alanine ligase [Candidatus Moranbacteria bacterium]|nr:UDP-N-acetylmuramoyl-tripeptide--D-alanyl-D-alanine ligase [Candidatus Moranbacteria bacterium]
MKSFIVNKILIPYLAWCAKKIIKLNRPKIIGVTGSVGKSSAKEAIYLVLKNRYPIRKNLGNLNNEIGLPLAIIGDIDPKSNIFKWLKVMLWGLWGAFIKSARYPKILVLEMAVDRPGNMKYLTSLAPPDIGVITAIGVSHLEFFKNQKKILKEKIQIFKGLPSDGVAIINNDDFYLRSVKSQLAVKTITYGFRKGSDIQAQEVRIGGGSELGEGISLAQGAMLRVSFNTIFLPLALANVISKAHIYAALAAMAVGVHFKVNLVEVAEILRDFRPLPGRVQLVRGKRGNLIIDDTYNSSPQSVKDALETLALVKSKKKTVILGDMLELGPVEEPAHRELARLIKPVAGKVVLVGKRTLATHRELRRLGFPKDKIFHYKIATALRGKIKKIVGSGEVILIKGSQGLRMEKITELLVPKKERFRLPRQNAEWKNKPVNEV